MEDVTKKIGFQYSKFVESSQSWDNENLAALLPSTALRFHLQHAIKQLLPSSHREPNDLGRLVVCIDDIDRCQPETAYRLLEGLKIYLNLDNCVFVIGMNQKIVEEAVAHQFGFPPRDLLLLPPENILGSVSRDADLYLQEIRTRQARVRYRATAYMEKICQNVWQLPAVADPTQTLMEFLDHTTSRSNTKTLIRKAIEGLSCLPPNPRRLKGLANSIGQFEKYLPNENSASPDEETDQAAQDEQTIEVKLMIIAAYIYHFHLNLFVHWEVDIEFYKEIFDACRGQVSGVDALSALIMPVSVIDDRTTVTPTLNTKSQFPDPTEANVFWIQTLILDLNTEVVPQRFGRYLGR